MKKKIILFCGMFLLTAFFLQTIQAKDNSNKAQFKLKECINLKLTSKDKLQIEDCQIGGIKLNQKISEVINTFGKPIKIVKDNKNEFTTYKYKGLEIEYNIFTNSVTSILVEKTGLKTLRGIGVGDKEDDVVYRYGETKRIQKNLLVYQKYISKDYLDYFYSLSFLIQNGRVSKITVYFAEN